MVIWRRPKIIRRRYFCYHRIYTNRDSDSEQAFWSPRLKWLIYEFERSMPQMLTIPYLPSYPGLIWNSPRLTRSIPSTILSVQNWANFSRDNSVSADSSDPDRSRIHWYSRSTDLEFGPTPIHSEMFFLWSTLQESHSLISNPVIHTMVSKYVKVLSTIHYQIAVLIPVVR